MRPDEAELPIIRAFYDFTLWLCQEVRRFPNDFKYVLGDRMQRHVFAMARAGELLGLVNQSLHHRADGGLFATIRACPGESETPRHSRQSQRAVAQLRSPARVWVGRRREGVMFLFAERLRTRHLFLFRNEGGQHHGGDCEVPGS